MKIRAGFIPVCVMALLLLAPGLVLADHHEANEKAASGNTADVAARGPAVPLYKPPIPPKAPGFVPPLRGRPAGRVGGGSRGIREERVPVLAVLVPDHVARTLSEEPSLFWYIDIVPQAGTHLSFAIIDEESIEPIKELTLEVKQPGVQRISLGEHGVKLEPGIEYEWSVALVLDPEQRSSDIIASGWISRVKDAPEGLASVQDGAQGKVSAYAQAGLWYDALGAISDQIDQNPDDASLRGIRASMLKQVGFQDVARAEM